MDDNQIGIEIIKLKLLLKIKDIMEYYCFTLKTASLDSAWDLFQTDGFELLYSNEEPSEGDELIQCIYGYLPQGLLPHEALSKYPDISSIHSVEFDDIDWHEQWGTTSDSPTLTIDLKSHSTSAKELIMMPGPGFGDLSHPTTRLVLEMMAPIVSGKWVIDLGSGSGILSLAALQLGALGACGIDIDPKANAHAESNARLNHLEKLCHFQLPSQPLTIPPGVEIVLVMNMIYSEQKEAWESIPLLRSLKMECITSGILASQENLYEDICQTRNWKFMASKSYGEWAGYHHKQQ